jgi:predicted ribosome quality control (RQC) complex YloA/Tae2 family protein
MSQVEQQAQTEQVLSYLHDLSNRMDKMEDRRQKSREEQEKQDKKDRQDLLIKCGTLLIGFVSVCFVMLQMVEKNDEKEKEAMLNEIKLIISREVKGNNDRLISLEHKVDGNAQAIDRLESSWENLIREHQRPR